MIGDPEQDGFDKGSPAHLPSEAGKSTLSQTEAQEVLQDATYWVIGAMIKY